MFTNSVVEAVDTGVVHLHSDHAGFEKLFPKSLLDESFNFCLNEVTKLISASTPPSVKSEYKIAVQLSDDSLPYAVHLIRELENRETERTKKTAKLEEDGEDKISCFSLFFFILADNTFAPCCADQVTAQRNHADVIIHFGQTCFSQSIESIPCAFFVPPWNIFPKNNNSNNNNNNGLVKQVSKTLSAFTVAKLESIVFIFSGGVDRSDVEEFKKQVLEKEENQEKFVFTICGTKSHELLLSEGQDQQNWNVDGASFPIAEKTGKQVLFFLSAASSVESHNKDSNNKSEQNSPLHQLALIEYWNSARRMKYQEETTTTQTDETENNNNNAKTEPQVWFTHFTATSTSNSSSSSSSSLISSRSVANIAKDVARRVNQRMRNVEALSNASSVGLLVMSLSISEHRNLLTKLQTLLRTGGKRCYVVFIGHLNEYKLANFADSIDIFVSLACPNSRPAFFAAKDDNFNIPLLFPAEVTLWYERDVKQIADEKVADKFLAPDLFTTRAGRSMAHVKVVSVPNKNSNNNDGDDDDQNNGNDDESGKNNSNNNKNEGALIIQAPMHIANPNSNTTGTLAKFQQRAYHGLDPRYGKDQVQEGIVDGLSGIAKSYGTTNQEENGERK